VANFDKTRAMIRTACIGIILAIARLPGIAQTMQVTDAPVPGDHIEYVDIEATPVLPSGASQTWTINGAIDPEVISIDFINPAAGEGSGYFPLATIAAYATSPSDTSTTYFNTFAGGLDLIGGYSGAQGIAYYSDTWRFLPYPCSFGTSWVDGYTVLDAPGGNVVYVQDPVTFTADGYGELIVNGHSTTNVLKVHSTRTDTFGLDNVGVQLTDVFWKPGLPFLQLLFQPSISIQEGNPWIPLCPSV
jgi:hypothetical protein